MHMRGLFVIMLAAATFAGCSDPGTSGTQSVPDLRCPEQGVRVDQDPLSGATHNESISFGYVGLGADILGTVWRFGAGAEDAVDGPRANHTFGSPGEHTIELRAFTREGCVVLVEHVVELENREPTAAFRQLVVEDRLILDGRASTDPNGDELSFEWQIDGAPVAAGAQAVLDRPAAEALIALVVSDPYGGVDQEQEPFRP